MFSCVLTQATHIKLSLFPTQKQRKLVSYRPLRFLLISSLPQHTPPSISPSVTRFKLVVVTLTTFLAYSTPGALLYSCC
ncbi:unnamed protein product [Hymenolepis diminuta]|uniref:Uncharacterized protein n=1 Tax=Hymenolepis diminuta TaxID=6216 RepID=A0A564YTU2_HYMDI|nr:unnamed protein product [Hymenolepis diminuta]